MCKHPLPPAHSPPALSSTRLQGDLTSPLYFDFISFCQAAAAAQEMARGRQVFREYSEEADDYVLVTRRAELQDNSLLPGAGGSRVATRVRQLSCCSVAGPQ